MNTPAKTLGIAILIAGSLAAPAVAQQASPPADPPSAGGPLRADPYGDATIARADAAAAATARFAALDTDHNGALSPAELAAGRPQRGPEGGRGGRRGGERGPDRGMGWMGDANGDGQLTRDEYVAGALRRYDMMDANHDGQLTKAEREAAFAAIRARMEERMQAMMQNQMGDGGGE